MILKNGFLKNVNSTIYLLISWRISLFAAKKKVLKIKSVILFSGLMFQSLCLLSQSNPITFDYLTSDDGLPDNRINVLYRDSKDYLWIGTSHNGLAKFDGINITTFEHADDNPHTISDNGIKCIYEDSKNNLWIGTRNGLNLYNPKLNSFTVFKVNMSDTVDNTDNYVTSILEDSHGDLWVTYNNVGIGLVKWDYKNNLSKQYLVDDPDNSYHANRPMSIREDSTGRLWVVSQGPDIYQFDPVTGKFKVYSDPAIDLGNNMEKCMYIDHNNQIWIGTMGNGLFSFDPSSLNFRHFGTNEGNKGINHPYVTDIIQIDPDHLLISTDQGGINKLNMASETFEYIVQNRRNSHGLNNNGVLALFQDREDILWVGTARGGVNYYNPKKNKFKLFEPNNKNPNSLSYNIVGCFYEDSQGIIWIGTDGGGLNAYDPKTGKFQLFKHDSGNPHSISGNVIRSITEDADKDLWIGTWDAGLNRYDRKTGKFHHYLPDKNDPSSISSKTSWNLMVDHNDNLWVDVFDKGIEIFDKEKGVIERFIADPNDPRSLNNYVWLFNEDHQNNIWICKPDGINLYDSTTNSFTVFNNFPSNDIRAFCRDKEGKLWAGSVNKGLFLFKMDGTVIKTYDKSNGLVDNTIHAIVEDDYGDLWISTNNGISHFNQETEKFRNYDRSDGLQGNTFFQQSFLKARNGEIYFGGYKGFNSFHPDSIKDNDFIPKVYFTDFKIFNKPVTVGTKDSPLKYHISETKELTLMWHQTVFSFEFSAINYTHPEKNEYAYILEGFEKEWNYIGNKRDATYTNLDPGEYTFRVIASNNDGVWNTEGAEIKIKIMPPFWRTWWFRFLSIFLLLLIAVIWYKLRMRAVKRQNKLLEKEVKERTLDLEKANDNLSLKAKELSEANIKIASNSKRIESLYQEVTDSIRAAEVLQRSILTPMSIIQDCFSEAFVLFRPKDIISGDFYLVNTVKEKIIVAAVDCTGHGVSGALMSIKGYHLLSQIIFTDQLNKASDILNRLNRKFSLKSTDKDNDIHSVEGMDISLCIIDRKNMTLQYAGANNPVYILNNSGFLELKADKFPIGYSVTKEKSTYTNHEIKLSGGDILYMFSDGYADQFGGDSGAEKFMYPRFRELLSDIKNEELEKQHKLLSDTLDSWQGSTEQIDDILVMGLKV